MPLLPPFLLLKSTIESLQPGLLTNKTYQCTFATQGYYGGRCTCAEKKPTGFTNVNLVV